MDKKGDQCACTDATISPKPQMNPVTIQVALLHCDVRMAVCEFANQIWVPLIVCAQQHLSARKLAMKSSMSANMIQ
eukprot:scaffold153921_cov16-Tisochrysis_lutea.AAC.2